MKIIRLFPTTAAFFMATTLSAQQSSDVVQVETAAAAYSASHLLTGTVAFVPEPTPRGTAPGRSAIEATTLAAALRAKHLGGREQFVSCATISPSSCRVRGADVIVSMNRPEIHGDSAFIIIRTDRATGSARAPVVREETRLRLERCNGVWRVTGPVGGGSIT
jgi:hypothetical protein